MEPVSNNTTHSLSDAAALPPPPAQQSLSHLLAELGGDALPTEAIWTSSFAQLSLAGVAPGELGSMMKVSEDAILQKQHTSPLPSMLDLDITQLLAMQQQPHAPDMQQFPTGDDALSCSSGHAAPVPPMPLDAWPAPDDLLLGLDMASTPQSALSSVGDRSSGELEISARDQALLAQAARRGQRRGSSLVQGSRLSEQHLRRLEALAARVRRSTAFTSTSATPAQRLTVPPEVPAESVASPPPVPPLADPHQALAAAVVAAAAAQAVQPQVGGQTGQTVQLAEMAAAAASFLTSLHGQKSVAPSPPAAESVDMSRRKLKYTLEEDEAILMYIQRAADINEANSLSGNRIWREMQEKKVTRHSWQSMRDHYLKTLLPRVNNQPPKRRKRVKRRVCALTSGLQELDAHLSRRAKRGAAGGDEAEEEKLEPQGAGQAARRVSSTPTM